MLISDVIATEPATVKIMTDGMEMYDGYNRIGIFQYSQGAAGCVMGFYYGHTGGVRNMGMSWSFDGAANVLAGYGTNRFSIESDTALVLISENSTFEWEGKNDSNPLTITGYILGSSVSKTINISNAGTTTPAVPFRVTAGDNGVSIQEWYQGSTRKAYVDKDGAINTAAFIAGAEQTAPAAPAANGYRIYAEDNGAGKTRLMCLFASGAAQQLAIEP